MSLLAELRRRNVIRVAGLYLVGAWLVVQVAETVLPIFETPGWVLKALVALLSIGFVPALAFAWVYELTPEGIRREKDIDRSASIVDRTARKLDIAVIVLLVAVGGLVLLQRLPSGGDAGSTVPSADAAIRADEVATADAAAALAEYERAAGAARAAAAGVPATSIAVLPFVNLSADAANEYFSDGITEEILNALTHIEGLKVAGRTSSFHFKGKNEDLKVIGAALGVAHVLEGSVRRQGERVRITAQLIKVDDGFHVWSQNYDRTLDDIFAVQDEISTAIAEALESRLTTGTAAGGGQADIDPATYDIYLHARQALATRDSARLQEAADLFAAVNERAPDFAPGWAGRAKTQALLFNYLGGTLDPAMVDAALQAADRALVLDPGNGEALMMKGFALVLFRWDFAAGLPLVRAAIAAAPNDAEVANFAGDTFRFVGELDEALTWEKRAAELDPLFFVNHSDYGWVLLMRHRAREAEENAARALRLDPTYWSAMDVRVRALLALGDIEQAAAQLERFARLQPDLYTIEELGARIAIAKNDLPAARALVARLQARADAGETVNYTLATIYARLGDDAAAARALERAFAARDPLFVGDIEWIQRSDWPDDPAIQAILARPGLAPMFAARARYAADGAAAGPSP